MADKSRFGPELTEAEIDASVEEFLILEFLMKRLFYSGLLDIKMIHEKMRGQRGSSPCDMSCPRKLFLDERKSLLAEVCLSRRPHAF